ncbi:heterogeneous nuclear ribonucleoprotein L-like isoform X2 [Protopterus annectens]|uniref:heterogeneous nuclear ribonucleoprotein L-like isoform X2 n=1 Tax=Protopterus annectens TaxID=7888 RepID=UPI001CFB8947|nr:heterogeneous nuclear ribonucleoprotein L-like isoform X2 [Protopterus annectens]
MSTKRPGQSVVDYPNEKVQRIDRDGRWRPIAKPALLGVERTCRSKPLPGMLQNGTHRGTALTPPQQKGELYQNNHKPLPSPVVHVQGLNESIEESDLEKALQNYGLIRNIMIAHNKKQALVEFESREDAKCCVSSCSKKCIYIGKHQIHVRLSAIPKITITDGLEDLKRVNHVLLFTIQNAVFPITTDVMYSICKDYGAIKRIVILRQMGIQAMVEFDSVQSAQRAKASLQGADIYSDCCTLKIDYAKPTRLNVVKNDSETWDYTNPLLCKEEIKPKAALLGDSPSSHPGNTYNHIPGYRHPYSPCPTPDDATDLQRPRHHPPIQVTMPCENRLHGPVPPSRVIMLHGLEQSKFNCDRIFNIVCLFGNVEQVKILMRKPETAMVQMGDEFAVERTLTHLNNAVIFDKKISICISKSASIVPGLYSKLDDGTPSCKDYTGSKNNRFTTPEQAAKNRIQHPSRILHFFNAPPEVTVEAFEKLCEEQQLAKFASCKLFPPKSDRSCSGLIEWESISNAMEAIVLLNHYSLKLQDGQIPYTLRLCFSNAE